MVGWAHVRACALPHASVLALLLPRLANSMLFFSLLTAHNASQISFMSTHLVGVQSVGTLL